jgi:recombination protein RecA
MTTAEEIADKLCIEPVVEDKKIIKKHKFVVQTLDDPATLCHVDTWISTQNVALDHILGGKGLPVRRIVECYGDSSTGKSLLATAICAETQRIGGVASYADCEIAQYPARLQSLGIDPKTLLYSNPQTVDDVFEALDEHIAYRNKHYGRNVPLTFAWDSLAAITTMSLLERADKDGDENKAYPDVARVMSQSLSRKINVFAEENVLLFVTNQTRERLGQMFGSDGPATSGGKALPFYASVRIELQTRGKIKDGKKIIGANVQVTTVKNRLAAPYQTLLMPMYYNLGADEAESCLNLMTDEEIIKHEKSSPWYSIMLGSEEKKFMKKEWLDIFLTRTDEVIATLNGSK